MRSFATGLILAALAASPALAQQASPPSPAPAPPAAPAPAAGPAAAGAPTAADIEKAKVHFARGKELFDKKQLPAAVEEFKESYRLSKNPVLLYNVGFTLDHMGQRAMALFYYQKFVAAAPADNPNIASSKERIVALQKSIEEASLGGAPAATAPTATPAPAGPTAAAPTATPAPAGATAAAPTPADAAPPTRFEHRLIEVAPPGKPIDVAAFVPPGGFQVSLFYRAAGEARFASVAMKPRYNEQVGRIPAEKTRVAPTVQYYIEVRDPNGQIVDRSGKATSPNLVFLEKSAPPHYYADLGDDRSYHDEDVQVAAPTSFAGAPPEAQRSPWLDARTTRFQRVKWGSTVGAASLIALSGTFYLIAMSSAGNIEDAQADSINGTCVTGPPCGKFSKRQQDFEGRGQRFETLGNVALGVGAVSAAAAGVFWYLEIKDRRRRETNAGLGDRDTNLTATPVVTSDFLGGAARLEF